MSMVHLHILFGEVSIQVLRPFLIKLLLFFGVDFVSPLQILDINPLPDVLANMSSHSVGCLFILLMFSFAMKKLFSLL